MKPEAVLRTRGAILLWILAMVGGLGCAYDVSYRNMARGQEQERVRRIAALEPVAATGNAAAMLALAGELQSSHNDKADLPRALTLLERAAAAGYAPAQAVLGATLATGRSAFDSRTPIPQGTRDRGRGLALLQTAATQGCTFASRALYSFSYEIHAADLAAELLEQAGDAREARLWRARAILHCHTEWAPPPASRGGDVLPWLLLSGDSDRADALAARMTANEVRAAQSEADDLRSRVAASEQRYPAPPREKAP